MKYRLETSIKAEQQLDDSIHWWAEHHSAVQAGKWYVAARKAIESLRTKADRCPRSPEDGLMPFPLRELAFGAGRRRTHRIVFTFKPNQAVYILQIRHLAQDALHPDELEIE
jgi:plasmid stabilization system protein ParE